PPFHALGRSASICGMVLSGDVGFAGPVRPYRSSRFLVGLVTLFISADALASVLRLAGQAWQRGVIARGDSLSDPLNAKVDSLLDLLSSLGWPLFIGSSVLFLIWIHRAFANLPSLGSTTREIAPGHRATPGAAVGVWFIPIANLVLGYRTVR